MFQLLINVMIAAAAYVVFIVGTYTRKNSPSSDKPSIRPASSSSFGNIFVLWRKKKIRNAVVIAGSTTAVSVSMPISGIRLVIFPNIRYNGTIIAANGIIIDSSKTLNTISFALLR